MNKATPFVVALGVAMFAVPTAYKFSPEKQLYIPASVSRQVENLTPLAKRPEVKKPVAAPKKSPQGDAKKAAPKAVVKAAKKVKPQKKQPVRAQARTSSEGRDFATDLRSLQDCKKLNALRVSGQDVKTQYQARLKAALIPWYLGHCLFA